MSIFLVIDKKLKSILTFFSIIEELVLNNFTNIFVAETSNKCLFRERRVRDPYSIIGKHFDARS
jgi:hypothetical protein